jgi:hypothetical protein
VVVNKFFAISAGLVLTMMLAGTAHAQDEYDMQDMMSGGRLLATGGVSTLEGAGGGGITPWALITGYGTDRQVGGSVFGTFADTPNLYATSGGVAIGLFNRVEFSYSRYSLNLGNAYLPVVSQVLNHGNNTLAENNEGIKVRLFGDAIYDEYIPQVSAGVIFQQSQNKFLVNYIGAKSTGQTYYIAATKLLFDAFLGRDVLLDGDLIETKANQLGLLGFGSSTDNGYHAEFAGSAAILINRGLAFGGEYRTMPRDLKSVGRASNYADVFVAYFPTKHFSVTAAYAFLGQVAPAVDNAGSSTKNENGVYISGQLAF